MSRSIRTTDHYERNRKKYRTILENLAALILDPAGYTAAFRSFLSEEARRRLSSAMTATLLFVAAAVLLVAVIVFFLASAFLFLDDIVRNPALTALVLAWTSVLLFFLLIRLSMRRYQDVIGRQR